MPPCIIRHVCQIGAQSFFTEHTDDILCLTVNRHPKYKNLVASGQLGVVPRVLLWQTTDKRTMSTLSAPHGIGVCSVDFSPSGKLLVTVGLDAEHTICVWKWEDGTLMAKAVGHPGMFAFRPYFEVPSMILLLLSYKFGATNFRFIISFTNMYYFL